MSYEPGRMLSHYRILEKIGEGGMGVVYTALDTRLNRRVALKVLASEVTADRERGLRFLREARSAAAVSHPNIATIHEIDEADGITFIVMELVEGKTLRTLMGGRPLAVPEALRIAARIAEGLAGAHQAHVIHRDLKPDNVLVTDDGRVKILDFGLAKIVGEAVPGGDASSSRLETIAGVATEAGIVMGTVPYMSPEQVRGKPVDARTDLWSLGCVLYELLAGRAAFSGETPSDTLAAILTREPDWRALPAGAPETVLRLLRRCLEKDPERRLRDADEAHRLMEEAQALPPGVGRRQGMGRSLAAYAFLAGVTVLFALMLVLRERKAPPAAAAAHPTLSQVTFSEGIERYPAWSPDGSAIAYAADIGPGRKIFLKRFDIGEERPLTKGSADDIQPAWSPDGRTVLFVRSRQPDKRLEPGDVFGAFDGGDVWSIDVSTGKETKMIEDAFNPSFSPDGAKIAVDASWAGPRRLWVLDSLGRNPQQITTDVSEAVAHIRPRWSPDGARIVFQNLERTTFDVRVVDVATKEMVWVTNDLSLEIDPAWSPSGRFIYFSSYRSGGLNIWRVPVTPGGIPTGPLQQLTAGAGQDVELMLGRDGKRLAFTILKQNADLWRIPVSPDTGAPTGPPHQLIATTREDSRGAWSPDGRRIAFNSDRAGDMNIWVYSLDTGATSQVTKGPGGDFQPSWSPDGGRIAFFSSRSGNADVWTVDPGSGVPAQVTRGASLDINPCFSPDGDLIAYQSDQGGRLEVWAMDAGGGDARPLSQTGVTGHFLRFSRDGQAVVYRCPCAGRPQTMEVGLDGSDPRPLAEVAGGAHMSFSPDFGAIMDAVGHKSLWASPLRGGSPRKVFEFDDPDIRIDYPVWSPDGRWVLLDRFRPQGGDIWLMERFE